MRKSLFIITLAFIAAAAPTGAATLPACNSKQAAEIAAQAVYDDWVLLGLKDTGKSMRPYFDTLHDGVDDESRALKRKLMRAFRVGEKQMRLCRAKPLGDIPESAPIVVFMISPITGGMGGFVARYAAGNRAAYFGDPIE